MSGDRRDETAEREEEHRLRSQALKLSIGHVLRRAAGLPDEEDPFIERSDEAHLPDLRWVVYWVIFRSETPAWRNPRDVEAKLEEIRSYLKDIKNRIASLDGYTQRAINCAGDPGREEYKAAILSGDIVSLWSASRALGAVPREQRTVPVALSAMEQLEAAIVPVIERAIEASARLPATGRPPNRSKNPVALWVAKYLYAVTGNIPALTTSPKLSGPFALALQEIFEILGLPKGVQRPGEYATSKLSENSDF